MPVHPVAPLRPLESLMLSVLCFALGLQGGCVGQSFPVDPAKLVVLSSEGPAAGQLSTRDWLTSAHEHMAPLLPPRDPAALLTAALGSEGRPCDVNAHFGTDPTAQHTLLANASGLLHTAQATVDAPTGQDTPPWPGFNDIWVPIGDDFAISGRIGMAQRNGRVEDADCIIMLPGILADKNVLRTRDLCLALRDAGFHVIAIDLRGHGRTLRRYPDRFYTFGVLETGDLLALSDWLELQPHIRHTGLMGFCWGANLALLAAWEDGRGNDMTDISPRIREKQQRISRKRHFQAGVVAFSPPLRFEQIVDLTSQREWSPLINPVLAGLQDRIRERFRYMGYGKPTGDLDQLIRAEARGTPFGEEDFADGYRYLRLLPYRGRPVSRKLEHARTPVLIVQAANDPLCPAQDVADFTAGLANPNVAALILAGGGHDGFAPYASDYFYSLIFNFYDPGIGAAANLARRREAVARTANGPAAAQPAAYDPFPLEPAAALPFATPAANLLR